MKSNFKNGIHAFRKGIFASAFLLQAISAVIWGIGNITSLPGFLETKHLLSGGYNDTVFGAGYRLLIRFLSSNGEIATGGRVFLYLFQFVICFLLLYLSTAAFFRGFSGQKADGAYALLIAAFVFTNPFYYPLVFSVLPDALAAAVFFQTAAYAYLWFRKREEENSKVFLLPVFAGLVLLFLLSERAFICGAVFVLLMFLLCIVFLAFSKKKEGKGKRILFAVAGLFLVALLFAGAVFANRISISVRNSGNTVSEEVNKTSGADYYQMLRADMSVKKKFIKECFSEATSPVVLAYETYPLGNTLNPYNVNVLWQKMPYLTAFYFKTGRISYPVGMVCLFAGWFIGFLFTKKEERKRDLRNMLFFTGFLLQTVLCSALFATLEFDYRSAILPYLLWGIFAAGMNRYANRTLMLLGKDTKWEKQP